MAYMRLGDLLVSSGVITNEQLEKALEMQKETKERLGDVLIRAALDEIVIEEYPEPYISASIGGAFAAGRILRTIRRADLAMYQAKLKKDCVAIYREAKERET